jgi:hypothetical protein
MKYLLMAVSAIVLCGCHSDRQYAGRPGDESYSEQPVDRGVSNKADDNVSELGRRGSPSGPQSFGNGSLNF